MVSFSLERFTMVVCFVQSEDIKVANSWIADPTPHIYDLSLILYNVFVNIVGSIYLDWKKS